MPHPLVDELQDLTHANLLLRLVASPGLTVFGVGDDDQVIYGYAGADRSSSSISIGSSPESATTSGDQLPMSTPVVEAASNLLTPTGAGYPRRSDHPRDATTPTTGWWFGRSPSSSLGGRSGGRDCRMAGRRHLTDAMAVLCRVNDGLLPVQAALAEVGVPYLSTIDATAAATHRCAPPLPTCVWPPTRCHGQDRSDRGGEEAVARVNRWPLAS